MSANHHTPIATGANADDTVFNAPLGQLDQTITDTLDGSQEFSALRIGSDALNAAATLQLNSTVKGALWFPRMTEAQRDAIATPPEGLLVYNTDDDAPNGYDGTNWINYLPSGDDLHTIVAKTTFNASADIGIASIPQDYQDLLLRLRVRSTQASLSSILSLRFNTDSGGANYAWNWLANFNLAPGSRNDASDSEIELSCPGNTSTSGRYLDLNIWIRNYTEASEKIHGDFEGQGGHSIVNAMEDIWGAFEWVGGAAIVRIDIIRSAAFSINGSYALYGLGTSE